MKKILLYIVLLISSFCYSQIKLINSDTTKTKYYNYKNRAIKSFTYKKQYVTSQTGESMYVLLDSVCKPSQPQRIIFAESLNRNYFYYPDSLIIRNWNLHSTPIENKNYFKLDILLKSKNFKNLGISFMYNRKDSLCTRIQVTKPDSLTYYTREVYFDMSFHDTKLKPNLSYKINNNSFLDIYINDKNFVKELFYEIDDHKTLKITFTGFYIPHEYGFIDTQNRKRFGNWFSYHDNGKLSSIGSYSGNDFDTKGNEINIKKTGKWIYFNRQGCIDKEENWQDGKLITHK